MNLQSILNKVAQYGYRVKTVSATRLPEIQEAVGKLIRQGLISEELFKKWHFYLSTNTELSEATTIIIIAIPQPITRLTFRCQGMTYLADIPPTYFYKADEFRIQDILTSLMSDAGYKIVKARIALKTLAVRSGLAEYGRNNISYVPGIGSFYRLTAFYTDYPCEDDNWQEPGVLKACDNCSLCQQACPTGSILVDRFLIKAENCLGSLAERVPDIPHWVRLQPEWPNALIGCMSCQSVCPVNTPYLNNIKEGISFSEEESNSILRKIPFEHLAPETREKFQDTFETFYYYMTQNLGELIKKQNC